MSSDLEVQEQFAQKEENQEFMQGTPAPAQDGQAVRQSLHEQTGMFKIVKGYDSVSKTIRIPEPTAQKLEQLAGANNISFNQLVNQCIEFALSHMYPEAETPKL